MVIPGIRGMSLKAFFKELFGHFVDDAVSDRAAQLAYYFLFSLFPFLFALVTLSAYLPLQREIDALVSRAADVMPPSAVGVLQSQLSALVNRPRPHLLTLSSLTTIWTVSRGIDAIRTALNIAYRVPESRPYWKTQAVVLSMTILGSMLFLLSFAGFLVGGRIGLWLASHLHLAQAYHATWSYARWPSTVLLAMLAAALMFYVLPDVEQEFKFITPGSVFFGVAWVIVTWSFSRYGEKFGNYNVTYGSIGGVIVLMTWLYLSGLLLIVGGQINSLIEHASAEGKAPGARTPDQPPPPNPEVSPADAKRARPT